MKNLFLFVIISLGVMTETLAQPSGFSYQAIIRTPNGEIIPNTTVSIRLSILTGATNIKPDYEEVHSVRTNAIGLVNLIVGAGSSDTNFDDLDWSTGPKFLGVAIDVQGGQNYISMGASEIQSVPYALYAANGGTGTGSAGPKGDKGETGEKGDQGDVGPRGAQGDQGNKGEKGEDGTSVVIKGTVTDEQSLDANYKGDIGDILIAENTGEAFLWNDKNEWINIGVIKGPKGDDGAKGEQGPIGDSGIAGDQGLQGIQGETGPEGPRGEMGPQGIQGEEGPTGDRGETGPSGPKGDTGNPGKQGEIGPIGPKGDPGPQGDKGEDGTSIRIKGTVSTESVLNLNYTGDLGDIFIAEDSGVAYVWSNNGWTNIGQIKGPQGVEGPEGIQGEQGIQGVPGPQGEIGDLGPRGEQGLRGIQGVPGPKGDIGPIGPTGPNGVKGDKGDSGLDGTNVKIVGSVPNASQLPKNYSGAIGDIFIDQSTGDAYAWDGFKWNNLGAIKGPKGDQGEQGPQGLQGVAGTNGADGTNGLDGADGINGLDGVNGIDGAVGSDGLTTLTKTTFGFSDNCPFGGVKIDVGLDDSRDGVLQESEIDETNYICNGEEGADGIDGTNGLDGTDGINGIDGAIGSDGSDGLTTLTKTTFGFSDNCPFGGIKIEVGLDDSGDGVLQEAEVDETNYICNGEDGIDGTDGANGLDGADGNTTLTKISAEPAGASCTFGGQKVEVGIDDNDNGTLESGEVDGTSYICDGKDGTDGVDGTDAIDGTDGLNGVDGSDGLTTLTKTTFGFSDNCPFGGVKLEIGLDDDRDGILQEAEVDDTKYICNGEDGTDGIDGIDGTVGADGNDGDTYLNKVTAEPVGANCSEGGQKIEGGIDTNKNGTLEAGEVTDTKYICDGKNGTDGIDGIDGTDGVDGTIGADGNDGDTYLNKITPEAAGANCSEGGQKIEGGIDTNKNGTLEASEVTDTKYICDGEDGTDGIDGVDGTNGTDGETTLFQVSTVSVSANCPSGSGRRIQYGIDDNLNGSLNLAEVDGTFYLCDGEQGATGPPGSGGGGSGFLAGVKLDYDGSKYSETYDKENNIGVESFNQTSPGICGSENTDILTISVSGESLDDSYFVDINITSFHDGPAPYYRFSGGDLQIVFCDTFSDFPSLSITISQ